jgi:hypothetical protein
MVKRYHQRVYEAQVSHLDRFGPKRVPASHPVPSDPANLSSPCWIAAMQELEELTGEPTEKISWDSFRQCYIFGEVKGPPHIVLN